MINLPVRLDERNVGVLLDFSGFPVITIDVNRDMGDTEVIAIARQIKQALNASPELQQTARLR